MRPGGEELKRLYVDENLNCADVGRRFGVSRVTARKWLIAAGITIQAKPNEKYPGDEEIRRLYVEEKKSLRQIAAQLDTQIPVVSRWLKRAGVQSRSIREGTILSGKYGVHSDAHRESLRENIAKARAGITAESRVKQREKMVGREPPNKGKPMGEAQRQKLIEQRADPEYRKRAGDRIRGEKSPWWKGGVKSELARRIDTAEWRRLRKVVYERDDWTCADCKQRCLNLRDSHSKPKLKIQAHHIIPRRYGGTDDLANLVTLCMSCHHKRERAYKPENVTEE